MADVVIVLLSGVLGAVVLAVVHLHKGQQKNRATITQLNAELAAQKILALTQRGPTPLLAPEPEPARRKRHLALYMGGIAAVLASLGDRFRDAWRNRRATTITVTAVASTLAVVSAFALTSGQPAVPAAAIPSSVKPDSRTDDAAETEPANEGPETEAVIPVDNDAEFIPLSLTGMAEPRADQSPRPSHSAPATLGENESEGEGEEAEIGHGVPPPAESSAPAPTALNPPTPKPTTPNAPTPAPTTPNPPTPTPTTPPPDPTAPPQQPDTCDGIGVKLPLLLDLCLG